ncbi:polyprenyl synthetase family protein [Glycomyces sp. NRRL B-16210]|uniref:polyprenyl synthetase family protein n=1 Tax=Glycomyces sp. NRRL B-16210 TaxID=1463821 RepID=UPI0006922732|nr:polyprenyl synthetase family protein [Glycomyces sp. NRRL B-16210]
MELNERIDAALSVFLDRQAAVICDIDDRLGAYADAVRDFVLGGGKRLRPAFAYWGARGAGLADSAALVACVSSLELLQASALMHDDLIDGSDTRRGAPSIHRRFASLHEREGWSGRAEDFGTAAAILLGDLCLAWSDELLCSAGMPVEAVAAARRDFDLMRTEVSAGQYLDVLSEVRRDVSEATAAKVARYKSAKYTIERPLLVGAALAGAGERVRSHYSAIGLPLGEAFQLRDDVLGVFGDPAQTGKPAGDDLREGKHTFLIARAWAGADAAQRSALDANLGDPDLDVAGVERLRAVLLDTGALADTERRIESLAAEAEAALESSRPDVEPAALEVFAGLLVKAVKRDF